MYKSTISEILYNYNVSCARTGTLPKKKQNLENVSKSRETEGFEPTREEDIVTRRILNLIGKRGKGVGLE